MWQSKTSFDEIRAWTVVQSTRVCTYDRTFSECHSENTWGEGIVQNFSDPKPAMATLGFTLEGDVALIYSWMGDTAATQPHTAGSINIQRPPGLPKDQNFQPCTSFLPPFRLSVTGKQSCVTY